MGVPAMAATTGVTTVGGTIPLVISNVQVTGITTNSATITWDTNGNANSQVIYNGTSSPLYSTLVMHHSVTLTGLSPNTTYNCVVQSTITNFMTASANITFKTLPAAVPPVVITVSGCPLCSNSAILTGLLTDLGSASPVQVYFQWGKTTNYGNETTHQTAKYPQIFCAVINNLTSPGTYHFRAVAVSSGGTDYGQDMKFNINTTTITLTSKPNPSVFGQSVTFTAKVTPSTATGNVTFYDGNSILGSGKLSSGQATYSTSSLSVYGSPHSITAVYNGDANDSCSTSKVVVQIVNNKTKTLTSLLSSVNPSDFGQSVKFTASVTPKTATGSITFYDGNTSLGSANLSGGSASISTTKLTIGYHNITAVYSGDTTYAGSTSNVVLQKVKGKTACTWPTKPNPSNYGQTCTFNVQLGVQSPGTGNPTGTVTFHDGSKTIGTGSLGNDGFAQFSISSLSKGTHSIMAAYNGDNNFGGCSSSAFSQVIK